MWARSFLYSLRFSWTLWDVHLVDDKQLAEKLAVLNRTYRQRLPGQIEEMEEIVRRLNENPEPGSGEKMLADLIALAHKMGGTAGTFGMALLGDQARDLEERCASIVQSSEPVSPAQLGEIRKLVGVCRETAHTASD